MERGDVGELEAHREVGQLPRRARRRVDAARGAEERVPAGVESPPAVLRHQALLAQARAEVREGHVAAQGQRLVEPSLERAGGEHAPQGLPPVALDAAAGHALDLHVGVQPRAVGRGGREQLGDRGRLAALREGGSTFGGGRARVAHRGEHGARARLDEDDRPAAPAEGLEGDPAQAEVDREPRGVALGQRLEPLRAPRPGGALHPGRPRSAPSRPTIATRAPFRSKRSLRAPASRASSARASLEPRPREASGTGLCAASPRAPASSPRSKARAAA